MRSATQYRVLAVLLVAVAGVLIGVLAALMDAAGGELLIPTIVLLYGGGLQNREQPVVGGVIANDAGRIQCYNRGSSFGVLRANHWFVLAMSTGSDAGALIGGWCWVWYRVRC
jgi:uncharacterized protein